MRINDFKNNALIVYATKGQIFLPRCVKIKEINLVTKESCYEDIPITFFLGSSLRFGYLTQDRVIRAYSRGSFCSNLPRYIKLPYLKKTIVVLNNKSKFTDSLRVKFDKLDFYDHFSYRNLSHIDSLVSGLDIIGQMHNLSISNENGGDWMIIPDNSKEEGFGYILTKFVDWLKEWSWYLIKYTLIFLFAISAVLLLGKFCLIRCKQGYIKLRSLRQTGGEIPNVLFRASRKDTMPLPQDHQANTIVVEDSPQIIKRDQVSTFNNELIKDMNLGHSSYFNKEVPEMTNISKLKSFSLNTIDHLNSGSRKSSATNANY